MTTERPVAPRRNAYSHFETLPTRWADNDIYGHMNNVIHYALFDTAVNGFLVRKGILDLNGSPTVFLVVSSGCDYFAEVRFPDTIHAGLRVSRLGESSVEYDIGLFRNADETASARGRFVHVNVDRHDRKPRSISDAARDILVQLTSAG